MAKVKHQLEWQEFDVASGKVPAESGTYLVFGREIKNNHLERRIAMPYWSKHDQKWSSRDIAVQLFAQVQFPLT